MLDPRKQAEPSATTTAQSPYYEGFHNRWSDFEQLAWRPEVDSSREGSPLIRARKNRALENRWNADEIRRRTYRTSKDDSDEDSVCSSPESQSQLNKLQQRCLLKELKNLRREMLLIKGEIHMDPPRRAGARSKLPDPKRDYDRRNCKADVRSSREQQSAGIPKLSDDWESLDLQSLSPSATSVEEQCIPINGCAKTQNIVQEEEASDLQDKTELLSSNLDIHEKGDHGIQSPEVQAISAKFQALWGEDRGSNNSKEVAVEPEPVRRSHRLQYAIDGLSEQSHDYALFSASLNKAMKAYALFSSPQRAEGLSDLASFEEVHNLGGLARSEANADQVELQNEQDEDQGDDRMISRLLAEPIVKQPPTLPLTDLEAFSPPDSKHVTETESPCFDTCTVPPPLADIAARSVLVTVPTVPCTPAKPPALPLRSLPPIITTGRPSSPPQSVQPLPKSVGFGKKLGRFFRGKAKEPKAGSANSIRRSDNGDERALAKMHGDHNALQRLGSFFRMGSQSNLSTKSTPRNGPAPWPLPHEPINARISSIPALYACGDAELSPGRRRTFCHLPGNEDGANSDEYPDSKPSVVHLQPSSSPESNLKVNPSQWLSNEKAQMALLLPAWVPSKLAISQEPPSKGVAESRIAADLVKQDSLVSEVAAQPVVFEDQDAITTKCLSLDEKVEELAKEVKPEHCSAAPIAVRGMLQNAVTLPPSYSQSAINGSSSPGSEVVAGVTADKPMLNASETFCKPELKSSVSLARSYSPFGRVNCRPERIVPHISLPQDRLEVAEEQHAIDTPVTRLEKQMKHDAGMEDSDDHSSQWRAVARHVITGQDLGTADKGFKSEGFGSRSSVKEVKRALELGLEEVREDQNRNCVNFQSRPSPSSTQCPERKWLTGKSSPPPASGQAHSNVASPHQFSGTPSTALPSPVKVKSPQQTLRKTERQEPRWTTKSAEEMASFPGVLALSRRFEIGLSNEKEERTDKIGAPRVTPRQQTARWAREQAEELATFQKQYAKQQVRQLR